MLGMSQCAHLVLSCRAQRAIRQCFDCFFDYKWLELFDLITHGFERAPPTHKVAVRPIIIKSNEVCDAWTDCNMTKWLKYWQMLAPEECREIRMEHDGEVHIAESDIRLLDVFIVVEVQHPPITVSEVLRREAFYDNMVWLVGGLRS